MGTMHKLGSRLSWLVRSIKTLNGRDILLTIVFVMQAATLSYAVEAGNSAQTAWYGAS